MVPGKELCLAYHQDVTGGGTSDVHAGLRLDLVTAEEDDTAIQ